MKLYTFVYPLSFVAENEEEAREMLNVCLNDIEAGDGILARDDWNVEQEELSDEELKEWYG